MPDYRKDNDADYDTGGDSFGQIFSDMFTGAASAAVSGGIGGVGGGIFNEFLEFLEGGSGGFSTSSQDDADLRELLQTATLEEVSEEMDDTEMVVKQLETKARKLDDEIFAMDAEARMTSKFSEKIELEEKAAELKARKEVVGGYLDRARKRLLKLQTRYKDLKSYGGSRSSSGSSSWNDVREEASTYERKSYTSSSSSSSYGSSASSYESTTRNPETTEGSTADSDGDSWMNEGFGSSSGRGSRRSSGRRRGSSRSRARVDSNPPPPSPTPSPPPPSTETTASRSSTDRASRSRQSTSSSSSSSSVVRTSNYSSDVPPHRRPSGSSYRSRQEEDRKRMQEIKVDEEFDKLKKELGL